MMSEDKFPRGWYTYIYPDGEVLISLEDSADSSDEEIVLH
jgi:hypothetical protein